MNPWFGVLAPAGTHRDIIARLNAEIVRVLRTSEAAKQLAAQGVDVAYSTPDEFPAVIKNDLAKWSEVVRDHDIRGG